MRFSGDADQRRAVPIMRVGDIQYEWLEVSRL
jgi:hypothetical protein